MKRPGLILAIGLAAFIVGGTAFISYRVYQVIAPKRVIVENRTDRDVTVSVPTFYRLDVGPHSIGVLDSGWFPSSGVLEITAGAPYKTCDWEHTRSRRLVVDDDGAHCHDIRADVPPYPTPVPP